jgi:uncharacterized protein
MSEQNPKLERRMFAAQIRADRADQKSKMVGYAAVFDSPSEDLGGFTETIAPGAFTRALQENQDVRALKNHNPDYVLGRTKAGTLRLSQDDNGLKIECDMPDTTYARDLMTSLDRGDIDQMSFGFYVVEEKWYDNQGKETPMWMGSKRVISDVNLFDISAVTYPAYPATSVEARSKFNFPEGKPESRDADDDDDCDCVCPECEDERCEACSADPKCGNQDEQKSLEHARLITARLRTSLLKR